MPKETEGRMINKDIADSDKFASLSKEAMVLFALLIPHYNSYGKMNGGPGHIKDTTCPKISFLTYENIPFVLEEITQKTNVKWFYHGGRWWIHSTKFLSDHQKLDPSKLGKDKLPSFSPELLQSYSRVTPILVGHEVEVEVEVEVEDEGEVKKGKHVVPVKPSRPTRKKLTDEEWMEMLKANPAYEGLDIDRIKGKMEMWCLNKGKKPTRARLLNWLNNEETPMKPSGEKPRIKSFREQVNEAAGEAFLKGEY